MSNFSNVFKQLSVVLLISLVASGTVLARTPEFPLPDDIRISHLGDSMRVNGNDVNVRLFSSDDSAQDILDFYREQWGEGASHDPGFTQTNLQEPWTMISRIEDNYLMTVQVQPTSSGGSKGILGLSRLPERNRPPKLGEGFPVMGDSQVLNEVASKDVGQSGRTMLLGNKHDIGTNAAFYRNRYRDGGWAFDIDRTVGGIMHVMAVRKGRQRVNMVITEVSKGGSHIVVNEVTHDIL